MIIDKFIDYKVMLLTVSITVFYLYITSNNNKYTIIKDVLKYSKT